jgi:glycosyltransferase involved in cell wall biosynthesis
LRVSALIPTYNRQEQVLRAIDSVLAQTVPVDEIIVVDDGSTDSTAEAIRSLYGSRVAVFRQGNGGVSAARNRGIRQAKGEWIAFLDSDDVWFPTKIERQLEAVAELGDEFGLCFTDCVYGGSPDMKLSVFQETGLDDVPRFGLLAEPAKYVLANREPFWTQSLLVRRSLLAELKGFDEGLIVREDTDVLFRLSFKTRFCFVAEPLVSIDRAPSRDGLCNLYVTGDDRMFGSLERLYTKWLAMPEVAGTGYEQPIREKLRLVCYDSAEAKMHQFRMGPALREIGRLRALDESYTSIVANLFSRKVAKLRRIIPAPKHRGRGKPDDPRLDLA